MNLIKIPKVAFSDLDYNSEACILIYSEKLSALKPDGSFSAVCNQLARVNMQI